MIRSPFFPLDHICYRVKTLDEYKEYKELFISQSRLYTEKFFHERHFHAFVLKEPLVYKSAKFYYLEFAEPGGSDSYERGFQHIEFLTNKHWEDMLTKDLLIKYLYESKNGERYIKYEDKIAIKITDTPQITYALLEDNSKIFVNR